MRTVERIKAPRPVDLLEHFIRPRIPVVITDLYEGQPIRSIRTEDDLREHFGHVPILVKEEYSAEYLRLLQTRTPITKAVESTVGGYLDLVRQSPDTTKIATENKLWPELARLFERPAYVRDPATAGSNEPRLFAFLANRGNVSAMHFDGDIAPLLHYHAVGRKRHILAPPEASRKLPSVDVHSMVRFQRMTEVEKRAYVDFIDAYDVVVEPGETLFMPAQYWHHVEYIDTAFSFNVRFGRSRYTQFIAAHLPRDPLRQGIAGLMTDAATVEARYLDEFERIEAVCVAEYPDFVARYKAMREVMLDVCSRMCPEVLEPCILGNLAPLDEMVAVSVMKNEHRERQAFASISGMLEPDSSRSTDRP